MITGLVYQYHAPPPPGWLPCDGSTLPRTAYRALFEAIGTVYGGDDSTFVLPNWPNHIIYAGVDIMASIRIVARRS